jgi:hypothetical protein
MVCSKDISRQWTKNWRHLGTWRTGVGSKPCS